MPEKTDVHAKLVLDDAASAALTKIKSGFSAVSAKVSQVQSEMAGMAKQALATAAGFQLSASIDSLKSLGEEAIKAALGAEKQQKQIAGLLTLTDKTGMSYEETKEKAIGLHDELEMMGIKAGVATDDVIGAFETIAERSGKSADAVKDLVEEMTHASKAMPGGMQQLAGAFRDLEYGIVRPRNALVMMIKQTGVMKGSAKDIAKSLSAMVQGGQAEKAFKLAEAAMGKMSSKMKNAAPTFSGLVQSLKDIRENVFEAMGVPILKTLVPPLERLKKYFVENKDKVEEFAQSIGKKVGVWVNEAAKKIEEGFKYIQTHADEIEKAIVDGARALKEAIKFIIDHKEAIAVAYGVKAAAPLASGAASAVGAAGTAGKAAMGLGGAIYGTEGLGVGAAAAASVYGLAVFTAAIVAVGAAAYHGYQLWKEWPTDAKDAEAKLAAMHQSAYSGNLEEAQKWRDQIVQLDPAMTAAADAALQTTKNWKAFADYMDDVAVTGTTDKLIGEFEYLQDNNNKAQMAHVAQLIANSDITVDALNNLTSTFKDGGKGLIDEINKFDTALTKNLKDYGVGVGRRVGEAPSGLVANFNGGQTINIKQDFRDQDPDRVAIAFRRDLGRNALNYMGSRIATGGGRGGF